MVTINVAEGPAYGVALLAGVGTGVWDSVEEACRATIKVVQHVPPIAENVAIYERFYRIYRALYPALKPQYDAVTSAVAATA